MLITKEQFQPSDMFNCAGGWVVTGKWLGEKIPDRRNLISDYILICDTWFEVLGVESHRQHIVYGEPVGFLISHRHALSGRMLALQERLKKSLEPTT